MQAKLGNIKSVTRMGQSCAKNSSKSQIRNPKVVVSLFTP